MSTNKFELIANSRSVKGKLACRHLRNKENLVPAIIYGGHEDNLAISLEHDKVLRAAEHDNFYSQILNLTIENKKHKVVLKDLQRHPFKPKILHLDFQRVKETDVLIMQVPLHFINSDQCPGVKSGGIINHQANIIEVRCQAKYLPEFLEVDLSTVKLGQIIHLSDLQLPEHVEILALAQGKLNAPVASVQLPRTATEETSTSTDDTSSNSTAEAENKESKDRSRSTSTQATQKSAGGNAKDKK